MVTVDESSAALRGATDWFLGELARDDGDADLDVPAGPLDWSCWTTLDHIADCQLAYGLQLASGADSDYLPVYGAADTDDFVHFVRDLGVPGVVAALPAFAGLLRGVALTAPADTRAFHPHGTSDPAGFAAMGTTEMLLHGHDVLTGLDRPRELPDAAAAAVLGRLFPGVEVHDSSPGQTLLWATGRADLPGRDRVTEWRWDGRVR